MRRDFGEDMRDTFEEYYLPHDDELRRYAEEAIVVPDSSVLLGLYQLSGTERDQVLAALEAVRDRLWIPYQVGLEYQRNRMGVIRRQAAAYEKLTKLPGARDLEGLSNALRELRLPPDVTQEVEPMLKGLAKALEKATSAFVAHCEDLADRHVVTAEAALTRDPVRARLDDLFAGRVGERPEDDAKAKRIKEGLRRFEAGIPPGFKDGAKQSEEQKAGDYLLWCEILDHAEHGNPANRPLLFVTADTKEDWFQRSGGEIAGPLPDLVREYRSRCAAGYHQVTLEEFLRMTNEYLQTSVSPRTIEKASTVGADLWTTQVVDAIRTLPRDALIQDPAVGTGDFLVRASEEDHDTLERLLRSGESARDKANRARLRRYLAAMSRDPNYPQHQRLTEDWRSRPDPREYFEFFEEPFEHDGPPDDEDPPPAVPARRG